MLGDVVEKHADVERALRVAEAEKQSGPVDGFLIVGRMGPAVITEEKKIASGDRRCGAVTANDVRHGHRGSRATASVSTTSMEVTVTLPLLVTVIV